MSIFNFNTINNANVSLGNGETVNVKKMSVKVDGKLVVTDKEISVKIENGTLVITVTR